MGGGGGGAYGGRGGGGGTYYGLCVLIGSSAIVICDSFTFHSKKMIDAYFMDIDKRIISFHVAPTEALF